ncbi:hypothetical protein SRHO_G00114850 [Serrasalmus rhombeus]
MPTSLASNWRTLQSLPSLLSTAFNTVKHKILLSTLAKHGSTVPQCFEPCLEECAYQGKVAAERRKLHPSKTKLKIQALAMISFVNSGHFVQNSGCSFGQPKGKLQGGCPGEDPVPLASHQHAHCSWPCMDFKPYEAERKLAG